MFVRDFELGKLMGIIYMDLQLQINRPGPLSSRVWACVCCKWFLFELRRKSTATAAADDERWTFYVKQSKVVLLKKSMHVRLPTLFGDGRVRRGRSGAFVDKQAERDQHRQVPKIEAAWDIDGFVNVIGNDEHKTSETNL